MSDKTIRVTGAYNITKLGGSATRARAPPGAEDPDSAGQDRALGAALLGHESEFSRWNVRGEIRRKLAGYRAQDVARGRAPAAGDAAPGVEGTLARLLGSGRRCYYCEQPTKVLYGRARAPEQWTLDRLDNSVSHTVENTVVSCMACNLRRRRQSAEAFRAVRQMKIVRTGAEQSSIACVPRMHDVHKMDGREPGGEERTEAGSHRPTSAPPPPRTKTFGGAASP